MRVRDLGIDHRPNKRKVDYYTTRNGEVHLLHEPGCQRAMTADGLCSCVNPETFTIGGTP